MLTPEQRAHYSRYRDELTAEHFWFGRFIVAGPIRHGLNRIYAECNAELALVRVEPAGVLLA